ncbi:sensor histidine kinase [uncultured Tessaracoccus sp.]|uniref:sensor histidine kinase n=1 Tax=uncultured Tessaracoccus sp. TaxID=905023 RepID=UPI0026090B68|nr:histidine kinase [uncultured Tessaracoccus sp.]
MVWPFRARRKPRALSHEERAARTIRELTESRRVIVDAYEVERRRIERDLHDGAQQYLVAAKMQLGEAQLSPALANDPALAALLRDAQHTLQQGLDSLRATVRGIHPQALVELGLEAALTDVANATSDDVRIICPNPLPELPEGVLAAAYFFAVEAITNARKYAPGKPIDVLLTAGATLRISVVDQGPGGATFVDGHGLAGMRERLAAFGGSLTLSSPDGGPTQVAASIPLLLRRGEGGLVAHVAAQSKKDLP